MAEPVNSPNFSDGFQRLYCDATVFDPFSRSHPISFTSVLPFQSGDQWVDDDRLIAAEEAYLAERNDLIRREVIEAYARRGLLPEADADNVKSVSDLQGADFFELMGSIYASAGMFICALRWYRECIRELEALGPPLRSGSDAEDVHASVGYCLYSLGLFEEAISWSKSCMGPRLAADADCHALMSQEAQQAGGTILAIERSGPRTRYTVSALDPAQAGQANERLKAALKSFAPDQEFYIDWVNRDAAAPRVPSEGYPFRPEVDGGSLPRHKMNLIFALCGQGDALVESGHTAEAKKLLLEAAKVEPQAGFILERLKTLP